MIKKQIIFSFFAFGLLFSQLLFSVKKRVSVKKREIYTRDKKGKVTGKTPYGKEVSRKRKAASRKRIRARRTKRPVKKRVTKVFKINIQLEVRGDKVEIKDYDSIYSKITSQAFVKALEGASKEQLQDFQRKLSNIKDKFTDLDYSIRDILRKKAEDEGLAPAEEELGEEFEWEYE